MAKTKISLKNITFNILAIIAIIAVGFILFNTIAGAKGFAVISNSMSPEFNKGDVVFTREIDFEKINVGDVVTVQFPDKSGYCTHRVYSIDTSNKSIKTKGDVNLSPDPIETSAKNIKGKVWYSVPYLGYFSIWFGKISTVKLIIILTIAAILLLFATTILSRIKKKKKSQTRSECNEQI